MYVMTAGLCKGTLSLGLSVDVGVVSSLKQTNRAGSSSNSVTVQGSVFGHISFTGMAQAGHTGSEGTDWESETSMKCLVGSGARGSHKVVMTVGQSPASGTSMLSFDLGSVEVGLRTETAICSIIRSQSSFCKTMFSGLFPSSAWKVTIEIVRPNTQYSDMNCAMSNRILDTVLVPNGVIVKGQLTVKLDADRIRNVCCLCNSNELHAEVTLTEVRKQTVNVPRVGAKILVLTGTMIGGAGSEAQRAGESSTLTLCFIDRC